MAQIKCPHCGHIISNRAPKCIYCGANVVKMQKCLDCGFEYPEKADACPSCGCPSSIKTKRYSTEKERDVEGFMLNNRHNFPVYRYNEIRSWLTTLNDRQLDMIDRMDFRETWVMLLVSVFLGYLGVVRFLLNDVKMGLVKLGLTSLSFLIIPGLISLVLWLMDIFKIDALTKEYNYNEMRKAVSFV